MKPGVTHHLLFTVFDGCAISRKLLFLVALFPAIPLGTLPNSAFSQEVDFDRDVRPILSENCVFCHGPDANHREADLRLDTQAGAAAVVSSGDHLQSELFARVSTDDPDLQMPPPSSNRSLTSQQVAIIAQWIDDGAQWTDHWAFRPILEPAVPNTHPFPNTPINNAIDAFVQQRLHSSELVPNGEATKRTLIRRLSLDLRGLPPSTEEISDFLTDDSNEAYERLVDRMLESKHFGQRMAWDWLDAARYADTNGYQGDRERTMWPWRDWVVDAFNSNLPFDQFTIFQLAGDQLPDATPEQILATGFCRNHMINGEGGRIAEENRVEYVMDMTETMGTVWLGLTLNCCRCHDHKYDPISNAEYYQFSDFFNQTPVTGAGGDPQTKPTVAYFSTSQQVELGQLKTKLQALKSKRSRIENNLQAGQAAWEKTKLAELLDPEWESVAVETADATVQTLKIQADGSVLATGPNPANDDYVLTLNGIAGQYAAIRLDALRHESMTKGGIARSDSGNFVLTDFSIEHIAADGNKTKLPIASAEATYEQGSLVVANTFDDDPRTGWAVYAGKPIDQDHAAVFHFKQPVAVDANDRLRIVLKHQSVHRQHNLGHFRIRLSQNPSAALESEGEKLTEALRTPVDSRDAKQREFIAKAYFESDSDYRSALAEEQGVRSQIDAITKRAPKVMIMGDRPERRSTFILERGLYNKPGPQVTAQFPKFLPSPNSATDQELKRLDLANWIVSDDNPLTARVIANRFWQQFFGIGLVKTTEDFGRQGERPEHLDLLNWLAFEFREQNWNVKHLIKTIVMSHTYRQSSRLPDPKLQALDPNNRLLARAARFRMPSWMLRDQALASSGLLSESAGGPAVNSYQPEGIWEEASFGKKKYRQDEGEKLYRRSLYIFWRRIIAPTMFFDAATRQTCTVKTSRTNTPLHALQTLNNTLYVEAARNLAEVALNSAAAEPRERLNVAFERVLARPANEAERQLFLDAVIRSQEEYAESRDAAEALLQVGESPFDSHLNTAELAAWTNLCLAIFNLDEALNRE